MCVHVISDSNIVIIIILYDAFVSLNIYYRNSDLDNNPSAHNTINIIDS